MIRRWVSREAGPHAAWNAFINLISTLEYSGLNPVQKIAHLAFWYDSEVENGGHCQRSILASATAIYDSKPTLNFGNVDKYVAEVLEGEFEEFDNEYYSCQPEMADFLEQYFKRYRARAITMAEFIRSWLQWQNSP